MSEIAVIGAGAWGTALSIVLGRKGLHRVRLWAFETEVREAEQRLARLRGFQDQLGQARYDYLS